MGVLDCYSRSVPEEGHRENGHDATLSAPSHILCLNVYRTLDDSEIMTQFEAVIDYAGREVRVQADSFAELHQALAGIEELNRDAEFLKCRGIDDVVPVYRKDSDENEYYGFQDRTSRRNITFGKKREKGIIPFFPKGEEGYYEPSRSARPQPDERSRRPQQHQHRSRAAASASPSDDMPF